MMFARWAFGPQGPPNLQVLAQGDFSHTDPFAPRTTFLFCRSPPSTTEDGGDGFYRTTVEEFNQWGSTDGIYEFLTACPVSLVVP
jgi:hypothetical protein